MSINTLYRKLFLSQYFFTIVIRKRQKDSIIKNRFFKAEYILPANRYDWAADPILVDYNEKTYLFYEAVKNDKGHIEVAEVRDDCTLSEATVILRDEGHYSYPFVFEYKGTWYMIPESSSAREVRLYQAEEFPVKWKLKTVLLNERAVDTTVFEQNGKWYLITFITDGKTERVVPRAYEVHSLDETPQLIEVKWEKFDELRVRGAGPVFREKDGEYRPAQISQEQRYGDALAFYKIQVDETYSEEQITELRENGLSTDGYFVDGLHTYCRSEKYEAIDIRCREFDLLKILRKIGITKNRGI